MDERLNRKIKLYCVLHNNRYDFLYDLKNKNCDKCRAKNSGVCEIVDYNREVIYDFRTNNILFVNEEKGYIKRECNREINKNREVSLKNEYLTSDWICFGFLVK